MGVTTQPFEREQKDRWPSTSPFHFLLYQKPTSRKCLTLFVLWVRCLVSGMLYVFWRWWNRNCYPRFHEVFVFQDLQKDSKVCSFPKPFAPVGCCHIMLCVLVLSYKPVSSLFHRMWFLLRNKCGVCIGHYCLWYYLDHLHHYFCVLLCNSPKEKERMGFSWWWALTLCVLLLICECSGCEIWQADSNLTLPKCLTGKRNVPSSISKKMATEVTESPYQVKPKCIII